MKLSPSEQLNREIESNFVQFFKLLSDEVRTIEEATCTSSAVAFPVFNSVIFSKQNATQHTLKAVTQFYQSQDKPFLWWLSNHPDNKPIKHSLKEYGFQKGDSFEGMSYDLAQLPEIPEPFSQVKVHEITHVSDMKAFAKIIQVCFNFTEEATQHYEKLFSEHFHDPRLKHFKIELEGRMVATGTLFMDEKICGFYNLAVLPEFRNQNLGQTMQWHRLHAAKAMGAQTAILHASSMAKSLDEKTGFKPSMKLTTYSLR